MNVHWTDTALLHLDNIFRYIEQNSPTYALATIDRLTNRSIQIGLFPYSGRKVPEYDIEEIREIIEGSYRIIYVIKTDRIDILAVIHGAQKMMKDDSGNDG